MRALSRAAAVLTTVVFAAVPALAVSPASALTATYSVQYLTLGNGQKVGVEALAGATARAGTAAKTMVVRTAAARDGVRTA